MIGAAILLWLWPAQDEINLILKIVLKGGLVVWGIDEMLRGVNPWRRCLGAAVVIYQIVSIQT